MYLLIYVCRKVLFFFKGCVYNCAQSLDSGLQLALMEFFHIGHEIWRCFLRIRYCFGFLIRVTCCC
jgi:hypothetical protein